MKDEGLLQQDFSHVSQKRLKEVLDYNYKTGWFIWKVGQDANQIAGCVTSDGYIIISIDGIQYMAHTLAWFYIHGEWTKIDHRNRVRHDNWIANLRPATSQQNAWNTKKAPNSLGVKGVYKHGRMYRATIKHAGKTVHIGSFVTIEEAKAAYDAKAKELRGEFHVE